MVKINRLCQTIIKYNNKNKKREGLWWAILCGLGTEEKKEGRKFVVTVIVVVVVVVVVFVCDIHLIWLGGSGDV